MMKCERTEVNIMLNVFFAGAFAGAGVTFLAMILAAAASDDQ